MGAIRQISPVPVRIAGFRVTGYATSTAVPVGLSADRKTVYGTPQPGTSTALYQSTDDGGTWTSIHTFPEGVQSLVETEDGEALVATQAVAATPGYVYKSSGWSTSHSTATWTKTLTTTGGFIAGYWGLHNASFGNNNLVAGSGKYLIVNEYGSQTSSSTPDATKATHAYFSSDYGATFSMVFDGQSRWPGVFPIHLHASAYDPYWDRLWITYGDTQADGTSVADVLYSDDHGVTWTGLSLSSEWSGQASFQSTAILPLQDSIVLLSDNTPGIVTIPRDGYRNPGTIQVSSVLWGGSSSGLIGIHLHRNRNHPNAPILAGFTGASGVSSPNLIGHLHASLDGGRTFHEVWRDSAVTSSGGVVRCVGPTYNGKIVGQVNISSTRYLFRGELVIPDTDMFDGLTTFTGDGATTVFNVAHGLGVKPNIVDGWGTSQAAAGTVASVTADATNIIFTFTAAPANAAVLDVAWRAAV